MKYNYNMTLNKTNDYNAILDEVYQMMVLSGFERKELNKLYLAFNLVSLTDDEDVYKAILSKLLKMNEKREKYEICSYINKYETELNEVE